MAIEFKRVTKPGSYTHALQEWEGVVVSRDDNEFVARLRDVLVEGAEEQLATIDVQEVSDPDVALIAPGAVFYWTIAQQTALHGQKTMFSSIRFQRPTPWSEEEVASVQELAGEFDDFFSDGDRKDQAGA